MTFTLNYDDGTSETRNVTFGDWYNLSPTAGTFFLTSSRDRVGAGNTYDGSHHFSMAGANLSPNSAKTLTGVRVQHGPLASGWFVFYGAVGW